jgi:hypothetical protein
VLRLDVQLIQMRASVQTLDESESDRRVVLGDRDPEQTVLLGFTKISDAGGIPENRFSQVVASKQFRRRPFDLL